MKAIVHSRYGPPDVLELNDIDQPVVTDDDALVRVHAAAVGKGDWLTVGGLPYVARLRYGLPKPKHPVQDPKLISILRQPELIAASRCYLIQMLRSALTCTNGCSCWSLDERNSPRFFLTMDVLCQLMRRLL